VSYNRRLRIWGNICLYWGVGARRGDTSWTNIRNSSSRKQIFTYLTFELKKIFTMKKNILRATRKL